MRWALFSALLPLAAAMAPAQDRVERQEVPLDADVRRQVIDGALKALKDNYVFPEVAEKMEQAIRGRQQRGEYDRIASGGQLAQLLTDHLRNVSRDKHLSVNYTPDVLPPEPPAGPDSRPSPEAQADFDRWAAAAARQNFGFVRVERLAGNVGYLDFREFMPPAIAAETASAAMSFLAGCDAVIFDLRQNGGGDPAMVAFLTTYLFGPEPVHLNDFYFRPTNETRPSWTLSFVPGKRLTDKAVYVLTSQRTFSGAEEFTYNLKHLKRATVVGETTGGGAHLVLQRRLNDHFSIGVPSGRPINAVTKTDWERTGVEPDVRVPAERALETAHLLALENLVKTLPADAMDLRREANRAMQDLRNQENEARRSTSTTAAATSVVPASKAADDFESGTLSNWKMDRSGSGSWFIYTSGTTAPDPGQSDPNIPFDVPNPPQGKYAAVTDMDGPGRRILYRDVRLDGRYRLRVTVFYVNAGVFSMTESGETLGESQQYRVDLVTPSAPLASLANEHVLATIFRGTSDGPARLEPTVVTFDMSRWAGQTVRLRLAVADNQGPLRAGVDDVRFERIRR